VTGTEAGAGVRVRRAVRLSGVVQGVGMRPHLHRLAVQEGLAGLVGNDAAGVFVEVEGDLGAVEAFLSRVVDEAPALAMVEGVTVRERPVQGEHAFRIVASESAPDAAAPVALVPPDSATCAHCLAEMLDPHDRRHRYPFIACTFCGPRFTIVRGVPYDRPATTMEAFPLCPACAREYEDPGDRRFHAQPTACPVCGPQLAFRPEGSPTATSVADQALADALRVLHGGGIVAVKGVGGYHLACDARRPEAVARLRARKRRSAKPFALLAADLDVVRGLVHTDPVIEAALCSAAAPIVLAPARLDRPQARAVVEATAPAQRSLGLMLPPSGLHHLLVRTHPDVPNPPMDLLVLTSGNVADEPICTDPDEADRRLAGIADAWLHHDRPVHLACDDSVVRVGGGHADAAPVRRSRGYAPLPVRLPLDCPPTLAVGGELKATVCLAEGRRGWLSQHLGDVASLETLALLERTVDVLAAQSRIAPERVVADLHPGYLSRRWAAERAAALGAELVSVQHHHAHLGSLLAEHGWPADRPVLGVTFDGTGYGTDGTIWGGELLLGTYAAARRVAHLRPVALPGGDAAIAHPARVALSHLHTAGLAWDERLPAVAAVAPAERRLLAGMLRSGAGCVPTTSMGRLFDAVSALAGVCLHGGYEGQPAMELEALLVGDEPVEAGYRFGVETIADGWVLDPAPVVAAAMRDVLAGVAAAAVSARFHDAVAVAVLDVARQVRRGEAVQTIGLTGGVFQNAVVTAACHRLLAGDGFEVLVHRRVPPNDGGLALGQAMVAACGGGR
jgi:hydrogenase maturation protein HypF